MAAGVDAIKAELVREFGSININEAYDENTQEVLLYFEADQGLDYGVRVSREYDEEYASGQVTLNIGGLGKMLRAVESALHGLQ